MPETADYDKSATPTAHKASHQDGGTDELSVDGLAGELTAEQKSGWAKVSGKPTEFAPEHHHATHETTGDDVVTRADILPAGGTTGQVLAKIDATNYNTEWTDLIVPPFALTTSALLAHVQQLSCIISHFLTTSLTLS